jgi:type IV pilus assembly protein PilA
MGRRRSRRDGFTLIELLVVVSIIGVLAAIAIPAFMGRQGKAYDARVEQDARNAATAEEAYFSDNTAYFSGDCAILPGVSLSPGVACNVEATSSSFVIVTSHSMATRSCTWTSDASPNLICS